MVQKRRDITSIIKENLLFPIREKYYKKATQDVILFIYAETNTILEKDLYVELSDSIDKLHIR